MFLLWLTHLPAWGVRQIAQSARLFSPAMNALGQSRRFDLAPITSGLPQEADIFGVRRHVSRCQCTKSLRDRPLKPNAVGPSPVRCSVNRMGRPVDQPITKPVTPPLHVTPHTLEKTFFFAGRVTLRSSIVRFTVMIVRCGPVVDRRLRWRVRSGLNGRGRS